jgi:hypothetical protein
VRSKVVFVLLLVMLGALAAGIVLRQPAPQLLDVAVPPGSAFSADTQPEPAAPSSSIAASASAPRTHPPLLDRPLRVACLGWDLAAPGILANDGLQPGKDSRFRKHNLDVFVAPLDSWTAVEAALARGGSDEQGADVAVLPFPTYVAAYERLRALQPRVFFVVGWSRGRETLYAASPLLTKPTTTDVHVVGDRGSTAMFLGLYALDAAAVPLDRIRLLDKTDSGKKPSLYAVSRDAPGPSPDAQAGRLLLTTADVPRLVPFVAVAQEGTIREHTDALVVWAREWLEGERRIRDDAAASSRTISKYPKAPEPLVLVSQLGPVGWASLADNARWAGLAGRGAATLAAMFNETWRIWRGVGELTTPLPEEQCVAPQVIAALVRSMGNGQTEEPRSGEGTEPKRSEQTHVLIARRYETPQVDDPRLMADLGLLAALFERSRLRVGVRGRGGLDHERTEQIIEATARRFGIDVARLPKATGVPPGASAIVEIDSVP